MYNSLYLLALYLTVLNKKKIMKKYSAASKNIIER